MIRLLSDNVNSLFFFSLQTDNFIATYFFSAFAVSSFKIVDFIHPSSIDGRPKQLAYYIYCKITRTE